ncbi:hypothetical protein M513_02092, partial [Trichuris suis]
DHSFSATRSHAAGESENEI